jgi:hypothetical protein
LFDLPKRKGGQSLDDELKQLGEDLELEDLQTRHELGEGGEGADGAEGWVDELDFLTDEECTELAKHLKPLRLMLAKVRQNSVVK